MVRSVSLILSKLTAPAGKTKERAYRVTKFLKWASPIPCPIVRQLKRW